MNNFSFSFLKSGVFWSSAVLTLSALFTSLAAQFPNVLWIGTVVSILSFISLNYFHKSAVLSAAQTSAALKQPMSGK